MTTTTQGERGLGDAHETTTYELTDVYKRQGVSTVAA